MSYILDALRKSEQQRQAIQPDSVTNRILVSQQQSSSKSRKWLVVLAISNLAAVGFAAWLYLHKPDVGNQENIAHTQWQGFSIKSGLQSSREESKKSLSPPLLTATEVQKSVGPSIAQMLEAKKQAVKVTETQRANQQLPNRRSVALKKDNKPLGGVEPKFADKTNSPASVKLPALDGLPSESPSSYPKLSINVFSYAEKPEDRFVIIDMVKYKTGQVVNGQAKLVEIKPDHIVLQGQNGTFTVDRP